MTSTWVGLTPVLLLSPWDAGPWCTDPTTACSRPPHTHQADRLVSFGPSARQREPDCWAQVSFLIACVRGLVTSGTQTGQRCPTVAFPWERGREAHGAECGRVESRGGAPPVISTGLFCSRESTPQGSLASDRRIWWACASDILFGARAV